jgi:hypothetical protein
MQGAVVFDEAGSPTVCRHGTGYFRTKLSEMIRQQVRLTALRTIDQAITSSFDLLTLIVLRRSSHAACRRGEHSAPGGRLKIEYRATRFNPNVKDAILSIAKSHAGRARRRAG